MKKISKFFISGLIVSLFAVADCDAQLYVKKPMAAPKTVKSARASKYEVWVPEEWTPIDNNKKYYYRAGYWAFPPTSKSVYVPGYWKKTPEGYYWIPGYWKNPHV
jgi:hypothetical protein